MEAILGLNSCPSYHSAASSRNRRLTGDYPQVHTRIRHFKARAFCHEFHGWTRIILYQSVKIREILSWSVGDYTPAIAPSSPAPSPNAGRRGKSPKFVEILPSLSHIWEREGPGMGEGEYGDVRHPADQDKIREIRG